MGENKKTKGLKLRRGNCVFTILRENADKREQTQLWNVDIINFKRWSDDKWQWKIEATRRVSWNGCFCYTPKSLSLPPKQELKGFGKSASRNSRSSWMNMQDYIQISENREKNYLDSEGSVGLKMMPKHQGKFQTLTFQIVWSVAFYLTQTCCASDLLVLLWV